MIVNNNETPGASRLNLDQTGSSSRTGKPVRPNPPQESAVPEQIPFRSLVHPISSSRLLALDRMRALPASNSSRRWFKAISINRPRRKSAAH